VTNVYDAAVARLQARGRFGIRLGLGRTRALLGRLGHPERAVRGVLIGGTNGKGSVQALVGAALRGAGLTVGQTPKPHLVDYRERVMVDGEPISRAGFAALVDEVLDAADRLAPRLGPPTEFEALTCAAFLHFARAGVDVAVVEVGLGGRLDATNVWQGGVSAITNVALDHTEHLGPTVESIAREKAHIIKRGDVAALTGANGPPLSIIERRARRVGVRLRVVEPLPVRGMSRRGVELELPTGNALALGLLGRHQAANAALALAVIEELNAAGMANVSFEAVRTAFATARWPGRLELLTLGPGGHAEATSPVPATPQPGRPEVLIDGAHNPAGTAALAEALDELRPLLAPGRAVLLVGVLRDKDVSGMLAPLRSARALTGALVVTTTVPHTSRSLAAAELAAAWGPTATAIEEPAAALATAVDAALAADGPLVICGSLYLVGHMRRLLLEA
jgi:dihydrofolate synthase / folylpolyglutamate synthase